MIKEDRDRNTEIVLSRLHGFTGAHIARKFGISRQRVSQIWRRYLKKEGGKNQNYASGKKGA